MFSFNPRTGKVTFSVHVPDAKSVSILGDFNGWNEEVHPLKQARDGSWKCDIKLEPGEYQFRYRVDRSRWLNDDAAPRKGNQFGSENSVVVVDVQPVRKPRKTAAKTARKK